MSRVASATRCTSLPRMATWNVCDSYAPSRAVLQLYPCLMVPLEQLLCITASARGVVAV